MVSDCKICGARTAGHRQYCPRCRRTHKYGNRRQEREMAGLMLFAMLIFILFLLVKFIDYYWKQILILLSILLVVFILFLIIRIRIKGSKKWENYEKTILFFGALISLVLIIVGITFFINFINTFKMDHFSSEEIFSRCSISMEDYCISLQKGDERYTEYNLTNLGLFESKEEILTQVNLSYNETSIKPNINIFYNLSKQELPFIIGKCYYKRWYQNRYQGETQLVFCNRYGIKK